MSGYTKLFSSIIGSTIWREPDHVRLVWITMLATANQYGEVECSVPGLADFARVSREQCDDALRVLMSPDQDSRTKTDEGRRIRPVDGGWLIINHGEYRRKMSADDRREYKRLKMREYRARGSDVDTRGQKLPMFTQAEAEAEAETEARENADAFSAPAPAKKPRARSSAAPKPLPEVMTPKMIERAECHGFHDSALAAEFAHFRDWHLINGKTSKDWEASWRTWIKKTVEFRERDNGRSTGSTRKTPSGPITVRPEFAVYDQPRRAREPEPEEDMPVLPS